MATPPDGSPPHWSHGLVQGGQDGVQDPYGAPSVTPGVFGDGYVPSHPLPREVPAPPPYEQPRPRIQTVEPLRRPDQREPAPAASSGDHPLVRPYTMTGGRTRPRYQLAVEALVRTSAPLHQVLGQVPEHQRICQLCQEIKSVAEISALLTIPLGVARILVADLAEAGLVAIHQPGGDDQAGGQPDVTLLERVLSGLRKL